MRAANDVSYQYICTLQSYTIQPQPVVQSMDGKYFLSPPPPPPLLLQFAVCKEKNVKNFHKHSFFYSGAFLLSV